MSQARSGPRVRSSSASQPTTDNLVAVVQALHPAIRAAGPKLRLQRKWMADWYVGEDLMVCVGPFSHHVGVEF
ncbi:MAG: hypothetical protein ACLPZM_07785 [Thermoplasmata archaeon]